MITDNSLPIINQEPSKNPIYRLVTRWSLFNTPLKIATMVVFLGVCVTALYFTMRMTGQIAFLGGGPAPSAPATPPVTPPVSPSPYGSPSSCVSGVTSASVSGACSTQGFNYVKYECANGQSVSLGDGKSCIDIYYAADQARITCGNICAPYSPRPSIAPSTEPKPSIKPSPSFSPKPSLSPRPSPVASLIPSPIPSPSPSPSPSYWSCILNCMFQEKATFSYCRQKCTR